MAEAAAMLPPLDDMIGGASSGPEIETRRLRLRQFRGDDLDAWHAIGADGDVMRYIGSGQTLARADAWRSIATMLGHWQLRGYGLWAIEEKATGRLIGRSGLYNPEGWPGLEVGWLLARDAWGHGYATEAGKASLGYAFEQLGATRVISVIHPLNARSIAVAERLGERYLGRHDMAGVEVLVYGIDRDPSSNGPSIVD